MTIWIVEGSTGEYSDHHEWIAGCYTREDTAKEHVVLATAWARANGISGEHDRGGDYNTVSDYYDARPTNPYDPSMSVSYTGVYYTCYPVRLSEAVEPHAYLPI